MQWKRICKPALVAARMTAMVYIGLLIYLTGCQRQMIYLPTRAAEPELLGIAAREGLAPWRNEGGDIIGWRNGTESPPPDRDAMLVFHGNAGYALHRLYLARGFGQPPDEPAFTVYLFEYPGYGARPGRPSEPRFVATATEAFAQVQAAHPDGRVFLVGESLGSGVAAHLAGQHPEATAGLFMATPFTSLADVAKHHYPYMPVHTLMRDRYEASEALRDYRGPLAILLAEHDRVVPARFGQALADGYEGPTRVWVQRDRDHNSLDYRRTATWWQEVTAFLKSGGQDEAE